MEDNVGIPEDLRCKRSDGKQWRCSALSMPDKTVCEKHYFQAKKRAANSALRASLKKAKRKSVDHAENYMDDCNDEPEMSVSPSSNVGGSAEYSSPISSKKYKEKKKPKGQRFYSPDTMSVKSGSSARLRPSDEAQRDISQFDENRAMQAFSVPPRGKSTKSFGGNSAGEYSGRSTDSSGEAGGITCHQCRRNDRVRVLWCMSCEKRGYCDSCVARWYADISMEDIRRACPSCRGICSCTLCRRGDTLIKARIREVSSINKLQYLHSLLSFALPFLKKIHSVQCFELDMENKLYGIKNDIPRAKINPDEQMCCDVCRIPIIDYHRHCGNCLTDLCLDCCRDIRRAGAKDLKEHRTSDRCQDVSSLPANLALSGSLNDDGHLAHSKDSYTLDFSHSFPKWKADSDGGIPCPDNRCCSPLVLRRIFKINWLSKLVKNAEEMVGGCKRSDLARSEKCIFCLGVKITGSSGISESMLYQCSHREDSGDNFLYCPASEDIRHETIEHFRQHWIKGEPVIVRNVVDGSLTYSWDPMSIWRGIRETVAERMKEDNSVVKAKDCLTQSEVDIELDEFIRGYSQGRIREDDTPEMLKLKDWPHPDALEEFLVCQKPEILSKFPLLEYIHSKWGLLNLAAKLPHASLQTDCGPKLCIAYGTYQELGRGDSVTNVKINMGDMVYLLMHTSEVKFQDQEQCKYGKISKEIEEPLPSELLGDEHAFEFSKDGNERSELPAHYDQNECFSRMAGKDEVMESQISNGIGIDTAEQDFDISNPDKGLEVVPEKNSAGVIWDVFRRQDIPKLNEYLRVHSEELQNFGSLSNSSNQVTNHVHDQVYFLNKDQKRKLKEEFGIEPWTFEQHVGEAIFVPAGCAFQTGNLKSSVQLAFDFVSPEGLGESIRLAQEIRCLPNDHEAKHQMLEVFKMPLYAASWAIREIQKISLDPKFSSELGFEDQNLTAMVSENLQRTIKRRRVACA